MYYFAYGSNMSVRRLQQRIPSANPIGPAVLQEHLLKFHQVSSNDDSAKCDATHTGRPEDTVLGVVFEISEADRSTLDQVEGLGLGYERKQVLLELDNSNRLEAFIYYLNP